MACACSAGSNWTVSKLQDSKTPEPAVCRTGEFQFLSMSPPGFFGGMFEQLRQVLRENYVIFRTLSACTRCHAPFVCMCPERITFILATALWISGSVLMYYAERDNPDEGSHTASRCTFLARSVLRADRLGERLRYSGSFPHAVSFLLDDWTGLHQRSSRERPFCPGACLQFGNNRASRVQVPTNPRGRPFTRSSCWWVSV